MVGDCEYVLIFRFRNGMMLLFNYGYFWEVWMYVGEGEDVWIEFVFYVGVNVCWK